MRMPDVDRDPPRDPQVGAWLGSLDDARPPSLEALRASIRARAELPLAARRRMPGWLDVAARWARPAIPLAAAAGVALAVLVGTLPAPVASGSAAAAARPALEEVLTASIPDGEYALMNGDYDGGDALLRFAVQEW